MKDPRSGPIGVTAIVLVLLLKFAALASVPQPSPMLWLAPVLARGLLAAAFATTPYVRSGGLGSGLAGESRLACGLALLITVVIALLGGWLGLRAMLVAALVFAGWRWRGMRRLGGMTGDTCGALVELAEAAVLAALAF